VRDFSQPTFQLTVDALIAMLGEPDARESDQLTYELGESHGRRHVLQVYVDDSRVASSNLAVWY